MLLHTEFKHDYSFYDECATSYNSEIEDCAPDDMDILQAWFINNTVLF